MNTINKREQFRLIVFTKLLTNDFNCTYNVADTILNTGTSLHYDFNIFILYTTLLSLIFNKYLILFTLS